MARLVGTITVAVHLHSCVDQAHLISHVVVGYQVVPETIQNRDIQFCLYPIIVVFTVTRAWSDLF